MKSLIALLVATLTLAGCSAIPRDPEHTLERIRSERVLRLGVSPNPPWTTVEGNRVGGTEVDLVRSFATVQGAVLETVVGGEEPLIKRMERGEVDVLVGGLTTANKWSNKVGSTRAYARSVDPEGKTERHVMAVRLGENRLLSELERHLDRSRGALR
ncbi:ABC transporter substrate-binding protein [Enemella dayhoffiae]|uniref:ABC transporter substrate-binding protein n=1 Tax=Enemella dayhoffiae TaxID=2016507 RepID=A0A255H1W2_9ACTN|nr:transporter substrate-binding domain-containing protein [Enemella dayhoffiae]OYO21263.1 ABC transporter substrate-binding protein [Enemella dayhoffiae]